MVIVTPNHVPLAHPGPHVFRLCDDAICELGQDPDRYPAVGENIPKRQFPAKRTSVAPVPLAVVYAIEDGERDSIHEVTGARAADVLVKNLYLEGLLDAVQMGNALMRCADIAAHLKVRTLARRKDERGLGSLAELLLTYPRNRKPTPDSPPDRPQQS